eukprot:2235080-Alexandrium_andersonii.AAC.1
MPRVDNKLPSEQGLNWQEYVRFGRDDFTTYFDTLWQDGWVNVQECPEPPPDDIHLRKTHLGVSVPP